MRKPNLLLLKLKTKLVLTLLVIGIFVVPVCANASIVFETTGWIIGTDGLNFEFKADPSPYTYQATLYDLSQLPYFGFDFLYLSVTSPNRLGDTVGPGSFTFPVEPGETYFANVFGTGAGTQGAGLFGLKIETVPIPTTVWLLVSGLIGIVGIRRKIRQ